MKIRDVIRALEADGWRQVRQKGSHRQFNHAVRRGIVTVPGHPGDDIQPGTLRSIERQAGVKLRRQ